MEKFINDILSKLDIGSKEFVYVSVTVGVGLEVIQVDPVSKIVKTYGHKPLEYSDTIREIADYDSFKTALQELFSESVDSFYLIDTSHIDINDVASNAAFNILPVMRKKYIKSFERKYNL